MPRAGLAALALRCVLLALLCGCRAAPTVRTTHDPEACAALALRSKGGLSGHVTAIAAVPEGIWVLRFARPWTRTLTLFGAERRPRVDVDVEAMFGPGAQKRAIRIASDGRVLGVLAERDDGTAQLATVQASGAFTRADGIDVQGALVAGRAGRFVVHDDSSLRIVAGDRVLHRVDEAPPDVHDFDEDRTRIIAATPHGYVEVLATLAGSGAMRVSARRLDAEGRGHGEPVLLGASEPDVSWVEPRPRIAVAGDEAVVVWRGLDAQKLARIGAD